MSDAYDLRVAEHRTALIGDYKSRGVLDMSEDDLLAGFEAITQHLGGPDWLIVRYGTFHDPTSGQQVPISVEQVAALGLSLQRLSSCVGFDRLIERFKQVSKIQDFAFEAHMAAYCLGLPSCLELELDPNVTIGEKQKRPDFKFRTNRGWFVCECKALHEFRAKGQRKFERIVSSLADALESQGGRPADFGLEFCIEEGIRGNLGQATNRVVARALAMCTEESAGEFMDGPFKVYVRRLPSPRKYIGQGSEIMRVTIGAEPVGIDPENSVLSFITRRTRASLILGIGELMNDAKGQLPPEHIGVIFLQVSHRELALEAINRRVNQGEYQHCRVFGLADGEGLWFVTRTGDEDLRQLFEGGG